MQSIHNWFNNFETKDILQFRLGHLKLRLTVCLLMLTSAFIGIIITDFAPQHAWHYWCGTAFLYAFLSVGTSFITAKRTQDVPLTFVLRECLHWLSLLLIVYLVSAFIHYGIVSDVLAGLFILVLLSLTTLLAGVHFDVMYLLIGIILGVFAIISAAFVQYFVSIAFIILIGAGILIFWQLRVHLKK